MFSKIVFPAVAATMVAADLPVIEVSLAGSAFSAMEKTRENMENSFIAQLTNKVSAIQRSSPDKARAISSVLDLHSQLFQTEKDHAATHASLMEAPTSLRVRVSGGEAALVDEVAKHETKLNAREVDMFRTALMSLDGKSSSMLLESQRAGDQEFAVKVAGGASMSFLQQVQDLSKRRGDKLREIRDVVSGVVAQLAEAKPSASFMEHPGNWNLQGGSTSSFPEFNVQYDSAAAVSLKGDESAKFSAALDGIIAKQSGVMSALEASAKKSMLLESDRVTQSPMVWLNFRGAAHASLAESQPMGESQATVNVFEAPHAALLQPEQLSAPFEVYDFFVEQGSGALPGLADIQAQTDQMTHASLVESLPAMNVHVSQGGAAVALSEVQQNAILKSRTRLISALKQRRTRLDELRTRLQ